MEDRYTDIMEDLGCQQPYLSSREHSPFEYTEKHDIPMVDRIFAWGVYKGLHMCLDEFEIRNGWFPIYEPKEDPGISDEMVLRILKYKERYGYYTLLGDFIQNFRLGTIDEFEYKWFWNIYYSGHEKPTLSKGLLDRILHNPKEMYLEYCKVMDKIDWEVTEISFIDIK
jgi:hypothetical protein